MYDSKENCVIGRPPAVRVCTYTEHQAEGVGSLVPFATSFDNVRFLFSLEFAEAGNFKEIGKVCGGETAAKKLGEGTASTAVIRVREVVVEVGFPRGWKEKKPIFLDCRPSVSGIAGEFCQGRVGLQRPKGWAGRGRRQ